MNLKIWSITLFITLIHNYVDGAKILGIFPTCSKSHIILGQALFKHLAKSGHEVTFVSPFPLKKPPPNYRDLNMKHFLEVWTKRLEELKKEGHNFFTMTSGSPLLTIFITYGFGNELSKLALEDEVIHNLVKSNEKFDIVISELFMNEVFLALADHFNAHAIGFSTIGASTWSNDLVGNPQPYSYLPNIFSEYTDHMTFFERLYNTFLTICDELMENYMHLPKQEKLRQKYFPHTKPLSEILNNVSLVLLNSHPSISNSRPLVPNMIDIGGFHVDPPKPLPVDLQKTLDDAKHGVIYFSMGSNLNSSEMPKEKIKAFLEAFRTRKETILWKFDNTDLPGKPNNLIISKWFPQQDILAHPNVKLFITHGGFLSTLETLTRGVPVIGIPIFGDQKMNMGTAVTQGYGQLLDFNNITTESVNGIINEMVNNQKYSKTAKAKSILLKDRIVNSRDAANYWIEYVLRHNGAPHLRTARKELNIVQYLLLDIISFVLVIVMLIIFLFYLCCKKLVFKSKLPKNKNKNKKTD